MSKIVLAAVLIRNQLVKEADDDLDALIRRIAGPNARLPLHGEHADLRSRLGDPKASANRAVILASKPRTIDVQTESVPAAKSRTQRAVGWVKGNKGKAIGGSVAALGAAGYGIKKLVEGPSTDADVVPVAGGATAVTEPPPVEPEKTWAQDALGLSTGSNVGDAAAAVAAVGGIYGLYKLLSKKEKAPQYVLG